jgi:energy-coupling factor transporter ATP-binding protein EcfA2
MTEPVLQARALARSFKEGSTVLQVLNGADLVVGAGERIAIVGASGSGKTTMLQVLGGLDKPDAGSVQVGGRDIHALPERERCELGSSTSSIICCRNFRRWKTWPCRCWCGGFQHARQPSVRRACSRGWASAGDCVIVHTSFRVGSGSALRWHVRW